MELEVEPSVVVVTALALLVAAAVLLRRRHRKAASDDGTPSRCFQAVPEPQSVSAEEPEPVQESQSCTGTSSATDDNLPLEPTTRPKVSELLSHPVNKFHSVEKTLSEPKPALASHLGPQTAPQPEAVANPEPVPVQETNPQLEPVLESLSTPETVPQLKPVCESLLAQEPIPETVTQLEPVLPTLLATEPVPGTVTQPEPVLEPLSAPETVPQLKPVRESLLAQEPVPETVTQLEPVLQTLLAPEPVLEQLSAPETVSQLKPVSESLLAPEAVPGTVTQPEPVREPLLAKSVTQPESAIETCNVLEQVSESTVKPALEQLSVAETSSEPEPVSDPVSIAQVVPVEEPSSKAVSEILSVVQSESEPNEVLQFVAEQVLVHQDESVPALLQRSNQDKPQTPEPVAERDVVPQAEAELNGEEDKVTFTPGKKANKFETLMTKEEMEEAQRVQQEQLAAIFLLLRENAEAEVGEVTEGDMEEQLKLYSP